MKEDITELYVQVSVVCTDDNSPSSISLCTSDWRTGSDTYSAVCTEYHLGRECHTEMMGY